jgi:hypothetical protein
MWRIVVTVRCPGVKIAPLTNTCTWANTVREKSGAKTDKIAIIVGGRGGMG